MHLIFQKQDAIQALINGGYHMKASQLHKEYGDYSKSIKVLLNAKLYPEAAAATKMLEDELKCPSEFSSLGIAKKYILKYCIPPGSINETEDRNFSELLKFINSRELQIAYLKCAKMFNEVLNIYFHAHEYERLYRIAFAQGPSTISPKKDALDSTTYYDSALRLSSALGHTAMNAAFVINHCRSYLYQQSEESDNVFSITQLEQLSCTPNRDVYVQVNAHLLLAKYDPSRVEDAIQMCQKCNCIPGEIELVIFLSQCKKLPSCYSTIGNQLEIVHKICFMLSLDKKRLTNAYKDILGISEGKMDKMYIEQAQFTEDLQLQEIVTDCYLLPHKNQDIWLRTLTQVKETTRDIDGMYVIPQDFLYCQIKHHLGKALNRALSRIIPRSPLYGQHLESCKYSSVNFDTECVRACLDCCELALLHQAKPYEKKAVKILREYHSIGNVHCLPLCENYCSFIDSICRNRRVWKFFQLETNHWITETLLSEKNEIFDSIKLWEQSSVAMVTDSLEECLEDQACKSDRSNIFKSCCRATSIWLKASKCILDDPFRSCKLYFSECLPELIRIEQNLHSTIHSMTVYVTVALALVQSLTTAPRLPIVIPQIYDRALSVYDSLLSRSRNETVLSACCALSAKHDVSDLFELLRNALHKAISMLWKESLYKCEDTHRQCFILTLTLFTNFIMLQPQSSSISQISSKLNKCIDTKITPCEKFELNYKAVGTAIKNAATTSDFIKILQYLCRYSGTTSSEFVQYEALALLVMSAQKRTISVTVLSDEEVQKLPVVALPGAKAKIKQELEVMPLLSVATQKSDLYFKVHPFRGKYPPAKVNTKPPWLRLHDYNRRRVQQPAELLDFLDLGFSQDLQPSVAVTRSESICHVCKVEKEESHVQSDIHKRNVALYKQFSALHDHNYVRCEAKFKKVSKCTTPKTEALLASMNNMITAVYKRGDWMKGIELIQGYCIPKVRDMTVDLAKL